MGMQTITAFFAERSRQRPLPSAPVAVELSADDDAAEPVAESLGYAEGQSFMIEYEDSRGRRSSRRITVYHLEVGRGGVPSLFAKCHERQAMRQFRVDRIRTCIDYSGEVHEDVAAFLLENFGMTQSYAKRSESGERWRGILARSRHPATLLCAMSHADGHVAEVETQTIVAFLARECEREDIYLETAEEQALARYVHRLRPTEDSIDRALNHVAEQDPRSVQRLLLAIVDVMDADGKRHPAERRMLNDLSIEITGAPLG